jgi:hypothetical protein
LSQCRVAAFGLGGLLELAIFFITISHCAWRRVISDMTFRVNRCFELCSSFRFLQFPEGGVAVTLDGESI